MLLLRGRRLRRIHLLGAIVLVGVSWFVYLALFRLADAVITSLRSSNTDSDAKRSLATKGRRMETSLVVAHYIGSGNLFGNLSDDVVNQNFYAPLPKEGAMGRPVAIPAREVLKMQHLYRINRYNLLASDRIPVNRTLPDVRKKRCIGTKYGPRLPTTSVIIVFHNEAWSVLLRTVWSVINRSPHHLVREILLVDDASDRAFLKQPLVDYVSELPISTKVLRLPSRQGLVPARLLGANQSTGETLTFLDAHCECSPGWLEPLLARVQLDRRKVACPVIDIVSEDNFAYIKSFELHWGAFNWQLHFRWYLPGEQSLRAHRTNEITPFASPAMAGGLFTIDRDYFYELGAYDEQMHIWGGDNLEMSFRVWQCGGEIEIVPCSHVGHLFRKSSPYTFPGGVGEVLNENLARTAVVWMDEWAEFFLRYQQVDRAMVAGLNVTSRKAIRQSLKCHSFEWYLSNIWPDHFFPSADRLFVKLIQVDVNSETYSDYLNELADFDFMQTLDLAYTIAFLNNRTDRFTKLFNNERISNAFCLQKPLLPGSSLAPYGQAGLLRCGRSVGAMNEMFVVKPDGHIMTNEGICLDSLESQNSTKPSSMVRIVACQQSSRQKWHWDVRTQQLHQFGSESCVTAGDSADLDRKRLDVELSGIKRTSDAMFNVTMTACGSGGTQKWVLLPLPWR